MRTVILNIWSVLQAAAVDESFFDYCNCLIVDCGQLKVYLSFRKTYNVGIKDQNYDGYHKIRHFACETDLFVPRNHMFSTIFEPFISQKFRHHTFSTLYRSKCILAGEIRSLKIVGHKLF